MTISSISFQSNISIILITIIIILGGIYFYLDSRKIKMQIETLEKSNEMFINEIEKINIGLHQIFNMNKSNDTIQEIVKEEKSTDDISDSNINDNLNNVINESSNNIIDNSDNVNSEILKDNIIDEENNIIDDILNEENVKVDDVKDDLEDEISDDDSDDDNNSGDKIELDEEINLDDEIKVDDDNLDELIDINIIPDDNTSNDLQQYLDMSVKELKEKCVDLGLKHSGNKHTLAQRIVDNLK